jgi:hypothetical protein
VNVNLSLPATSLVDSPHPWSIPGPTQFNPVQPNPIQPSQLELILHFSLERAVVLPSSLSFCANSYKFDSGWTFDSIFRIFDWIDIGIEMPKHNNSNRSNVSSTSHWAIAAEAGPINVVQRTVRMMVEKCIVI